MRAMTPRTRQGPLCKGFVVQFKSARLIQYYSTISTQTKEYSDMRPSRHFNSYTKRRALSPAASTSEPRLSDEILDLKAKYLSTGGQGTHILEQLKILEEESRSLEASVCFVSGTAT